MKYNKIFLSLSFFCLYLSALFSQEALKSTEEEYYNFLSLSGYMNRPTLGYRTLSDSVWTLAEKNIDTVNLSDVSLTPNIWSGNNLGITKTLWKSSSESSNWYLNGVKRGIFLKIYGPEWFNSYNTAAPYGQNDGALWQGKGYNTSLTTGIRFEGYGLELTFKPQVSFSQNLPFDYITPVYSGSVYTDKAAVYGYYGVKSLDAPQRFGDSSFWTFDWGDSEVRYTWNTFTVGFGTQSIWLGPAQLNPILHSNNAASYPKLDVGLRRTSLYMPWFGWYLGDIEGRAWWGYLNESTWFDNDSSNDDNLLTGLTINYSVPFLPGLTVGVNRTMLSKWDEMSSYSTLTLLNPFMDKAAGADRNDQRASITADWLFPSAGLNLYLEWARNDYSTTTEHLIRYPFHTQAFTTGFTKTVDMPLNLKSKLILEISYLESSRDYGSYVMWGTTFYAHHIITQGYTNKGQWIGAGMGTGGNSQYLGFETYYKKGSVKLFMQRTNPDMDYVWFIDTKTNRQKYDIETSIRASLNFGIEAYYYLNSFNRIGGYFNFVNEHNPLNKGSAGASIIRKNFYLALTYKLFV